MASRFWVGGTGTWDASTTTHWSATTGGAGGASVPATTDDVFFDGNSGVGTATSSITLQVHNLDCTGYTGTLVHQTQPFTVTGPLYKLSALMTYAPTTINFSPSFGTTQLVTTAGHTLSGVTAGGSGTIQLQDTLTCSSITQNSGTFDTQSVTINATSLTSSNGTTRTLTLGSSAINLSGGGAAWSNATATSLVITANTAVITLSGAAATWSPAAMNYNGASVVFSGSGACGFVTSTATTTFANITRTGTAVKTDSFTTTANITCTSAFTANSNSDVNRLQVRGATIGTAQTITAASVVVSNTVDFMDITGAGAATWTVAGTGATALGDCQGNSGITFTPTAIQYRVGASASSTLWSDSTKWASTTGGSGGTGRVPLPQDDVVFDNNTSASGVNVPIDMPRAGHDIDLSAYSNGGTFTNPLSSTGTIIFGSWKQGAVVFSASASVAVTWEGRGTHTLTFNNSFNAGFTVAAPGGSYTLQTALNMSSGNLVHSNGTFDANGFAVTASTFTSNSGNTRTLNMGGGNWSIASTSAATTWSVTSGGLTLNNGGSAIILSTTSTNSRTFAGGGMVYGALTYTVAGSTGALVVTGGNSFTAINFSDVTNARSLTLPASTTTIITTWNVNGTSGKLMTVKSSSAGTAATISFLNLAVSDYLSVQDLTASTTTPAYAGSHGTLVSGNTNWLASDVGVRLQTGVAHMTATTTKTQAGKANLAVPTTQTTQGKGRVTKTATQTTLGKARITATASRATAGKARVTSRSTATTTGKSRIRAIVPQPTTGHSRITAVSSRIITATAKLSSISHADTTGKGSLFRPTPQTITGKAHILNKWYQPSRPTFSSSVNHEWYNRNRKDFAVPK